MLHKRHESEDFRRPFTAGTNDGEVGGVANEEATGEERAGSRDERDKERWAKLKRLKQAFHVKRRKGRDSAEVVGTAGPKA